MRYLLTLMLIFFCNLAFTQVPAPTINIGTDYANYDGEPTFAWPNSNIKTEIGVYILNESRYDKYKGDVETMGKIRSELDALVKHYEKDIASLRSSYDDLIEKCQDQTGDSKKTFEDIEDKLKEMEDIMAETQSDINSANEALVEAQKKLKKERKKSMWTKILYGAGGVGVGVILGVLVGG